MLWGGGTATAMYFSNTRMMTSVVIPLNRAFEAEPSELSKLSVHVRLNLSAVYAKIMFTVHLKDYITCILLMTHQFTNSTVHLCKCTFGLSKQVSNTSQG